MKNKPFVLAASIAALLGFLAVSPRASAQQFWDGPHIDNTTIEGGTGTWNNTNLNWANTAGVGGNTYSIVTPVIFSGAAGIVTLGSNITVLNSSVRFSTDGYLINPNGFVLTISNSFSSATTFTVDAGLIATINAPITGSTGLSKSGAGTLILSGVNTYSGSTLFNAGVLSISQDANLGAAPGAPVDQLTFNGGTLQATASFALNANRGITLLGPGGTISVTGASVLSYGGVIGFDGAGAFSLTKSDAGTLILSGVNTYPGITVINAGVLSISQDANLGTPPGAPVDNQLTFGGGTLQATASFALNANRGITLLAGDGTIGVTAANMLTYGGVITGAGSLTKIDAGTLILSGINTYSGITAINAGVLSISQDTNLGTPPGAPVGNQLTFDGGALQAAASFTLNPNRGVMLNAGGGTFDVAGANVLTYGGVITGPGNLTKIGTGTLTLSGSNTYGGATLVSGGTLQAGSAAAFSANSAFTVNSQLDSNGFSNTIGSLAGNGIVTNNGGALATLAIGNDNTNTTFSGSLRDGRSTLGLSKVGTGTLILTGANNYSGGTNLNGGILAVQSDANLGTGQLRFNGGTLEALAAGGGLTSSKAISLAAGGGTFLADAGTASTLSGPITGVGAWTKAGPGTLTLTGANTYGGGTTISAGTLRLGAGGTTGSITGNVANNGILAFNRSDVFTFGGVISGTGSVQQNGTGTTVLTANNTYTGGTIINAGALQLGSGGTTGSIIGNVIDNGALIFTRSDAVTFGGVISGTGNVIKLGAGTLTLPGTNTYTGSTTVNGGTLIVDGSIASANTLVNPGGVLGGRGIIGGNLVSSGVVSPGSSPATLTVSGDYTQNPSGTLRIEVAGLAPSQHDVLAVSGKASLAGTVQLVRVGGFNLSVGDQITFLTATNGVSGTFDTVENDFLATGSIVVFDVVYLPNGVVLEGTQGSFAEFALAFCGTPNSVAVGQALDSAVGDPRASELIGFLNNQTLTNLCDDIDLISPEQLTSIFVIGVSLANVQTANLERRMADIHAGSSGFSSSGFAINGSGPSFSEGFAGVSGPEGKSGPSVFAPIPQNRWGVFVTGIGEFTDVDSTFNASGYDLATGGFTMGIDYRIGSHFAIGLTGGYAYTSADLVNDSSVTVNGGKLGLYATAFGSGFYLDTAVIGGLNGYDTRRTALEGTATGDTLGGDLNVLVAAGYDWKKGGLSIGPTASFQYTLVGFGDYAESGSLAPLAYPSQHAESFRTAFGMKASYDWKIGPVQLIPEVRLAWQHEFGDTDYSLISSFASGAGNSFTVNGPEIGRDSMLLGAGFAIRWNDRISTYAYYDGELFRTNYLSNNVSAGFRVTF